MAEGRTSFPFFSGLADASSGAELCRADACSIPMNYLLTATKRLRRAFVSKFP